MLFALSVGMLGLLGLGLAISGVVGLVQLRRRREPNTPTGLYRLTRSVIRLLEGLAFAVLGALVVASIAIPAWVVIAAIVVIFVPASALALWEHYILDDRSLWG